MATFTVERDVSLDEVADVLRQGLGERYRVNPRRSAHEGIGVAHGMQTANVRVDRSNGSTTFRIHGGGFIASRLVNELGFARRVGSAIRDGLKEDRDSAS